MDRAEYLVHGANNDMLDFTIRAAEGAGFAGFPTHRTYVICLKGILPATSVSIDGTDAKRIIFNDLQETAGVPTPGPPRNTFTYEGGSLTVMIYINVPTSTSADCHIQVQLSGSVFARELTLASGWEGRINRFIAAKATLDNQWGTSNTVFQDDYPSLLYAAEGGEFLTYQPWNAATGIQQFSTQAKRACQELTNITNLLPSVQTMLSQQLC